MIKLDSVKAARKITGEVERRIRADYVSSSGKKDKLGPEFQKAINKVANETIQIAASVGDLALRERYVGMLNDIAAKLTEGFPQGKWKPFTPKYRLRKLREKPETADVYWKFMGGNSGLAKSMKIFAATQANKAGLGKKRGMSKYTTMKLIKQEPVYRGRRYRYTVALTMPEIKASEFKDIMFRKYFLVPEIEWGWETAEEKSAIFRNKMQDNEKYRPWVRDYVKSRGRIAELYVIERFKAAL